jgi:Spondin-like TSP1 domain
LNIKKLFLYFYIQMSYGNYFQGSIDSVSNSYNVVLSGSSSGYTSSGLMIGGDTSTMYGVKISTDSTHNAFLDLRADNSNKISIRHKNNSTGLYSTMLDLANDSSLTGTGYGAVVNGRMQASSYYVGFIDTRAPINTGLYQGYDGNVGFFNMNKGTGTGGFKFNTYNSNGTLLQNNLNLMSSGVVQASYYTATGNAADTEPISVTGIDANGNLIRNYAANARFRALEARATAIENDITGAVPTKVNELVTRLNGLDFFSQNISTIAVFYPAIKDCVMSEWSGYGTCSTTCGGGTQTQTRSVISQPQNGGAACPTELSQTRSCNTQPCPINCAVSDWSSFGACSATCGGGTQTHTRTVTTQPQYGGTACPVLTESQACNTQACPVNCEVSGWSDSTSCSVSCGGGTKTQTRTVTKAAANGGTACPVLSQSVPCNTQACPVDCQVSGWSGWSGCSASCGGGTQTQTRSVTVNPANGGAACPVLSQSQSCNTQPCTLPNGSGCSVNSECSGGYCNNGVCYSGPAVNASVIDYGCYSCGPFCGLVSGQVRLNNAQNGGVNNTGFYDYERIICNGNGTYRQATGDEINMCSSDACVGGGGG